MLGDFGEERIQPFMTMLKTGSKSQFYLVQCRRGHLNSTVGVWARFAGVRESSSDLMGRAFKWVQRTVFVALLLNI